MRVARWRWLLVLMMVVIAGCLPRPTASTLEAAFTRYLDAAGMTFTPADPGEGVMSAEEVVAAVQSTTGADRLAGLAAVPVFGVLRCLEESECRPGPGALVGMNERPVWVLFYPDLEPEGREPGGWIVIDGPTGLQSGFEIQTPRNYPVPVP